LRAIAAMAGYGTPAAASMVLGVVDSTTNPFVASAFASEAAEKWLMCSTLKSWNGATRQST
jgi:hypothetical protein